jgi:hypothetical protein
MAAAPIWRVLSLSILGGLVKRIGWVTAVGVATAAALFLFPVAAAGQSPAIRIVKFTNGQDANSKPGPTVPVGSTVTWTYVVTNTGDVPLGNVVVTDNKEGAVTSFTGDTNGNGLLDLTETWVYTLTGIATAGQYKNTAKATGTLPIGQTATATDLSHYFGV